ncbi:NAD(P)H-dependent glycerol-3-phosphate dehydrogenase [Georgfuchsia toluolica]|uniref:NAD(P)H-dependent glycerol-3-phosphate dehydrogenase n=1 Tax=Georgfuchsia toluolica TaxID=424218 RepID=UPI001C73A6C4|nr:NAD(P)H-dependent glycerol-3-phosphate dehydrogenase [Georgfuchsia toluolica]
MKITVIGAGAWGTALAINFAQRHAMTLIADDAAHAAAINQTHENARYLPGHQLPQAIVAVAAIADAADADLFLIATPVAGLRSSLLSLQRLAPRVPLLWVCKGLEAGTALLPHQVAAEVHPGAASGVLTGPSFAEEVARGLPTAVVLASHDAAFAMNMANALHGSSMRIYANDDLIGAEVGGAVKNVLAIATGISDGLGLGLNARAALVTRGLAEITRFGVALGARSETFMGLTGVGDLILTCTGDLSRNRRVGFALASGTPLEQVTRELGHVAEGVPAAREVALRAEQLGIDMPITRTVIAVLDGRLAPSDAVGQLMAREAKIE